MTRPSPIWRGILWVERFLPSPPTPLAEPSVAAKRRAVLASQLVLLAITLGSLQRYRSEIGALIAENDLVLAQVALVVAGCVAVAAIGFGLKAWRDATGAR